MRASKARTGLSAGQTCHKRWSAYGKWYAVIPEVGAVCGKAARTDLCGGRGVTRVPTATEAKSGDRKAHPGFRFASLRSIRATGSIRATADAVVIGGAPDCG
jgi:hypothetical protein